MLPRFAFYKLRHAMVVAFFTLFVAIIGFIIVDKTFGKTAEIVDYWNNILFSYGLY